MENVASWQSRFAKMGRFLIVVTISLIFYVGLSQQADYFVILFMNGTFLLLNVGESKYRLYNDGHKYFYTKDNGKLIELYLPREKLPISVVILIAKKIHNDLIIATAIIMNVVVILLEILMNYFFPSLQ